MVPTDYFFDETNRWLLLEQLKAASKARNRSL